MFDVFLCKCIYWCCRWHSRKAFTFFLKIVVVYMNNMVNLKFGKPEVTKIQLVLVNVNSN